MDSKLLFRFWLKGNIIWIIILKDHPGKDSREVNAKAGKPLGNYYMETQWTLVIECRDAERWLGWKYFFVNRTDRICLEIACGAAKGKRKRKLKKILMLLAWATGEDIVCIYHTGKKKEENASLAEMGSQEFGSGQVSSGSFSSKWRCAGGCWTVHFGKMSEQEI